MAKKLKVGVIGLGMGKCHVRGFANRTDAEVAAAADLSAERRDSIQEEYGVPRVYEEGADMLEKEDLDIAVIATPNVLHAPLTIKALEADCHVLCEKPMAMSVEEAESMQKKAEEKKKVLMVNFSYRFSDITFALKEQIAEGVIGDVYYVRSVWHRRRGFPGFGGWFGKKELSGGGPLVDLGVHRIDLALWLMGNPRPVSVYGVTHDRYIREMIRGSDIEFDCEDLAVSMIKLEGGITLMTEVSWGLHGKNAEYMRTAVYGTKGSAVHKNIEQRYSFEGWLYTEKNGVLYDKKIARSTVSCPDVYGNMVDVIQGKDENYGSAQSGVDVQKILNGIYQSAETGKEVVF